MAAEIFTEYEIVNPLKMHKFESNKSRQFEQDGENIFRIKQNPSTLQDEIISGTSYLLLLIFRVELPSAIFLKSCIL